MRPLFLRLLAEARKLFTLVVITNGPEFSQVPKVERVNLAEHVDHIIIGGQEPEEKPAPSIFYKALKLANCEAHEAVHVGDSLATGISGAHNSGITSVWIQHQQPLDLGGDHQRAGIFTGPQGRAGEPGRACRSHHYRWPGAGGKAGALDLLQSPQTRQLRSP